MWTLFIVCCPRWCLVVAVVFLLVLFDVAAVTSLPFVACVACTADERTGQIDAAHFRILRAVGPRFATFIHIHITRRCNAVCLPSLITDTPITILRLHARPMTTQFCP
uniref:Uncharacterized protein n=1 Tax=Anopheles darlingi TaxID=43151 RepID=A0A2M4D3Y5_ANODA